MILSQYLPVLTLFGIHRESGELSGFIGIADEKIEMLFVHPDDFGKGIGRQLCHFAIQNQNVSKVDVNEDNIGAFRFYTKMGFEVTNRSQLDPSGNPFPILHLEINHFQ